jgi:hypothetical protein
MVSCREYRYYPIKTLFSSPGECGIGGDGSQPVIIQIEQNHLGLCRLQNQVTKLLNLNNRSVSVGTVKSTNKKIGPGNYFAFF